MSLSVCLSGPFSISPATTQSYADDCLLIVRATVYSIVVCLNVIYYYCCCSFPSTLRLSIRRPICAASGGGGILFLFVHYFFFRSVFVLASFSSFSALYLPALPPPPSRHCLSTDAPCVADAGEIDASQQQQQHHHHQQSVWFPRFRLRTQTFPFSCLHLMFLDDGPLSYFSLISTSFGVFSSINDCNCSQTMMLMMPMMYEGLP